MNKGRGISLIVLILTILVMIILATTIILSINNSGIIGKASEGTFKNDLKVAQEELQVYIENQILNDSSYDAETLYANMDMLEYDGVKIENQNIKNIIPSLKSYLERNVRVVNGVLEYIGDNVDDDGIPVSEEDNNYRKWAIDIGIKAKLQNGYDYLTKKLLSSEYALSFIKDNRLEIPDSPEIKIIGESAYYNVEGLASVKLSKDVVTIEKYAFKNNASLTSVDLAVLLDGGSLETIDLGAFYYCSKLEEVKFPSTLKKIDSQAFNGCSSLKKIEIPDLVTYLGSYSFYCCSLLESVKLPKNLEKIANHSFGCCYKLAEIEWPEKLKTIGDGAFAYCYALTGTLVIPEGVTSIGQNAFLGCTGLKEIVLPSTLSSIGLGAFNGCENLEKINIPASVTDFGYGLFTGCNNLTDITYDGDDYVIDNGILYDKDKTSMVAVLGVPSGTVTIPASVTSIDAGNLRMIIRTANIEFEDGNTKYMVDDGNIYIKDSSGNPVNLVVYNGTGTTYNAPSTLSSISEYPFIVKGERLTSINLASSNVSTLKAYSFRGCYNVVSLNLNNGITSIDDYALQRFIKSYYFEFADKFK